MDVQPALCLSVHVSGHRSGSLGLSGACILGPEASLPAHVPPEVQTRLLSSLTVAS